MISPTTFDSYSDYLAACKVEAEVPAPESVWRGWRTPAITPPDTALSSPSTYLQWLTEQLSDLKYDALHEGKHAELLWTIIREQRLQDERLRGIEKMLRDQEGGK